MAILYGCLLLEKSNYKRKSGGGGGSSGFKKTCCKIKVLPTKHSRIYTTTKKVKKEKGKSK